MRGLARNDARAPALRGANGRRGFPLFGSDDLCSIRNGQTQSIMPVVNQLARELVFKVVYYGPGLGGKTTSLQHIHATTRAEHRGKMVSLATPVDRTLYFDFLPIRIPSSHDMTIRLQLFTVPGQVYYNATRKLVLTGADGVVFVVDSQRARSDANIESLRNLEENLLEHGRSLDEIPHVFSYNKRDLPGLIPIDDMERLFNPRGAPSFATVATSGEGVYETLEAITRAVMEDFEHRMPEHRGLGPSALALPEGGLAEALRMAESDSVRAPERTALKRARFVGEGAVPEVNFTLPPVDDVGERAARILAEAGISQGTASGDPEAPIELLRTKRLIPETNQTSQRQAVSLSAALSQTDSHADTAAESSDPADNEEIASPLAAMTKVLASLSGGVARHPQSEDHFRSSPRADSRIDTRTMMSDSAPAVPVAANAPKAESSVVEEASLFSLSSLWSEEERPTVVRVEEAIRSGELRDSVLLMDVLVQRCLEVVGSTLGQSALESAMLQQLLGMTGAQILGFRMRCERARSTDYCPSKRDCLCALLYATELRLAIDRLVGA